MFLCVYWCVSPVSSLLATMFPITIPVEEVLEERALLPLLLDGWRAEDSTDGLVEHSFKATLSQGWALQVLDGTWDNSTEKDTGFIIFFKNLLSLNILETTTKEYSVKLTSVTNLFGHCQSLGIGNGREFLLLQLLHSVLVISQIQLGADKYDGSVGTMVSHLRVPLHREHNTEMLRGIIFKPVCYLEHVTSYNMWTCYKIIPLYLTLLQVCKYQAGEWNNCGVGTGQRVWLCHQMISVYLGQAQQAV